MKLGCRGGCINVYFAFCNPHQNLQLSVTIRSILSISPLVVRWSETRGFYTRNRHIPTDLISNGTKQGILYYGRGYTRNTPDAVLKLSKSWVRLRNPAQQSQKFTRDDSWWYDHALYQIWASNSLSEGNYSRNSKISKSWVKLRNPAQISKNWTRVGSWRSDHHLCQIWTSNSQYRRSYEGLREAPRYLSTTQKSTSAIQNFNLSQKSRSRLSRVWNLSSQLPILRKLQ